MTSIELTVDTSQKELRSILGQLEGKFRVGDTVLRDKSLEEWSNIEVREFTVSQTHYAVWGKAGLRFKLSRVRQSDAESLMIRLNGSYQSRTSIEQKMRYDTVKPATDTVSLYTSPDTVLLPFPKLDLNGMFRSTAVSLALGS